MKLSIDLIRLCPWCGSFLCPNRGLCENCLKSIMNFNYLPKKREIRSMNISSLFSWKEGDIKMGVLMKSLKGSTRFQAWQYWARLFASEFSPASNAILIPVTKSCDDQEHAFLFAKALSIYWQLPVQTSLVKKDVSSQKKKSVNERKKLEFQVTGKIPKRPIVLVDDIVTSGATAKAAFLALGKPEDFSVFSLVYREFSCDRSSGLL